MELRRVKMTRVTDGQETRGEVHVSGTNNNTAYGDNATINQITINLVVPPGEMRDDMLRALRHPEVLQRLPHTPPEEITALLFQYARGAEAPGKYVSVEGNNVLEKRPNGDVKKQSISKYVKETIGTAMDVCVTDARCLDEPEIAEARQELETKDLPGPRKRGPAVSRYEVAKMYALGDQGYYKVPVEGRQFISKTVRALDRELDLVIEKPADVRQAPRNDQAADPKR
jgi:hypothetical protein